MENRSSSMPASQPTVSPNAVPANTVADAYAAPVASHGTAIRIGAILASIGLLLLVALAAVAGVAVTRKVQKQPDFSSRRPVPEHVRNRAFQNADGSGSDSAEVAPSPAVAQPQP